MEISQSNFSILVKQNRQNVPNLVVQQVWKYLHIYFHKDSLSGCGVMIFFVTILGRIRFLLSKRKLNTSVKDNKQKKLKYSCSADLKLFRSKFL